MLLEERQQWQMKEEMMRDHMHQQWHWTQCAEEYDSQLQAYYQERAKHQLQCVRLNQILYGVQPSSTTFPPPAQPIAISPGPAARSPLHNVQPPPHPSGAGNQKKKRSAEQEDLASWDMQNNHIRMAKRHHQ